MWWMNESFIMAMKKVLQNANSCEQWSNPTSAVLYTATREQYYFMVEKTAFPPWHNAPWQHFLYGPGYHRFYRTCYPHLTLPNATVDCGCSQPMGLDAWFKTVSQNITGIIDRVTDYKNLLSWRKYNLCHNWLISVNTLATKWNPGPSNSSL